MKDKMLSLLIQWAEINSGSDNLEGLHKMLAVLKQAFSCLNADIQEITLPPRILIDRQGTTTQIPSGSVLFLKKHPKAPIQILLGGHYDTVYSPSSAFQKTQRTRDILIGPGVADMKGGLVIMLHALKALEESDLAGKIGWEVVLNPDEEIGSPSSSDFIADRAKGKLLGLIFEPAYSDGKLVSSRKGSANYTLIVRGRAAHAGRDFHEGRSAISALARFIVKADRLTQLEQGTTLNFGHIEGGITSNIVADLAICKLNVRVSEESMKLIHNNLEKLVQEANQEDGISMTLWETSSRDPKPFDKKSEILFDAMKVCGAELGLALDWQPSGGVSDGNILASVGIPCIDTLGAVGGKIHTHDEYILIPSLEERTSLASLFLKKLAMGALKFNGSDL